MKYILPLLLLPLFSMGQVPGCGTCVLRKDIGNIILYIVYDSVKRDSIMVTKEKYDSMTRAYRRKHPAIIKPKY